MTEEQRKAWLEERNKSLGGSDIPIIMGLSPYKTPFELWQEKTGKVELEQQDTPQIKRGRVMEPIIADMYGELTGRTIRDFRGIQRHPDKPHLAGNMDKKIFDPDKSGAGILEIKAPALSPFGKMVRTNSPRYNDLLQIQHYMLVTGLQWGAIACHNSEHWQMIHWDIPRDNELIAQIEEVCDKFWECVINETPPEVPEIVHKMPDIAGEAVVERIDTPTWIQAVQDYSEAKDLEREVTEMVSSAKARIKEAMGDYRAVEGSGVRAYFNTVAGRKSLDVKALAKAHPEVDLDKFQKTGKSYDQLKVYFLRGEE